MLLCLLMITFMMCSVAQLLLISQRGELPHYIPSLLCLPFSRLLLVFPSSSSASHVSSHLIADVLPAILVHVMFSNTCYQPILKLSSFVSPAMKPRTSSVSPSSNYPNVRTLKPLFLRGSTSFVLITSSVQSLYLCHRHLERSSDFMYLHFPSSSIRERERGSLKWKRYA